MANLTRYKMHFDNGALRQYMQPIAVQDGEWVKFEDVKEILPSTSSNIDYVTALFNELKTSENALVGFNAPVNNECISVNIERLNAAVNKLHST